jgi:hypothetical protein
MKHRDEDETEYQAKVIDDDGLRRSKVPSPLLREMGARAGDYLIYRLTAKGEAMMHVSRSKGGGRKAKTGRPAKAGKKRAGKRI